MEKLRKNYLILHCRSAHLLIPLSIVSSLISIFLIFCLYLIAYWLAASTWNVELIIRTMLVETIASCCWCRFIIKLGEAYVRH